MPFSRFSTFLLLVLAASASASAAASLDDSPANLLSRATKHTGPLAGYVPLKWAAGLAGGLFAVATVWQWTLLFRHGRRYMLTLTIGMTCMTVGLFLRIPYSNSPESMGLYIIMYMLVLLSPCAFLANQYILLNHLASCFDPSVADACLLIPSRVLVRIFVTSDIITFFVQAAGGGLSASGTASMATISKIIVLIGLAAQLASFVLYTIILIVFGWRMRKHYPQLWSGEVEGSQVASINGKKWTTIYKVILTACTGVIIRSIFRVAENADGGYRGYLSTHEVYMYFFDSLPLWISMGLYCFFWPVGYISPPVEEDPFNPGYNMNGFNSIKDPERD